MPSGFEPTASAQPASKLGAAAGVEPALSLAVRLSRLRAAAVGIAFLLPLIVLPGIERPFSTPKFALLGLALVAGAILAARYGILRWPRLPAGFETGLAAWLAALGLSAALGTFASLEALLLPLVATGWFLLLLMLRPRTEQLALALALSGGVVASVGLLQFLALDPFRLLGWAGLGGDNPRMRVFATLGNPNFVAAFLIALMPLTLALRNTALSRRRLLSLLLGFQALALFATGSRAPILALALVLAWLAGLRQRVAWRTLGASSVLVAALLAFTPARPLTTTLEGRAYIWQVVAPHLAERPLLGFGPGSFVAKYAQWETERLRTGRASAAQQKFAGFQDHAHNDYLEMGVEQGAAGALGFLALLASFLIFAFRHSRRSGTELVWGASAGVVALAAVALVDFPLQRPTELFLFWTLMGIAYLAAAPDAATGGAPGKRVTQN